MGVYSKTLHHVNNKNFKKTRQRHLDEQKFLSLKIREQEILEQQEVEQIKEISSSLKSDWKSELFPEVKQEVKKEEVKVKVKVPEKLKSDWKKELSEGMTTGGQEIQFAPSDVPLDTIDASDPASFTVNNGGFDSTFPQDGLMGATIVSDGTGSGNNGGFNLGKSYLSFNGTGYDVTNVPGFDNTRAVILTPLDSTRATTLEITAIVGNGSNGGEAPGVDQDITLWYTDPNGDFPNSILSAYDEETFDGIVVVPYNGSGSLRNYSITIPSYLRKSGVSFVLLQSQGSNPSLTGDNYGITEIKLKRTTPISVIAPLDSPEAVSFFRVGTGPNVETPEQRYRRVMQQLLASKNYTTTRFGSNYPGSNFTGISGVVQPPTWDQAAAQTEIQQTTANIQSSIDNFEKAFSDIKAEITKTTALQSFNNIIQGKETPFVVGYIEGLGSKQSEILKALGPSATSTFNQIQQYKDLNQKLSQSRNPADWDRAVQVSASIQQLYDKFGKEMKGEIGKAVSLPPDLTLNIEKIDKQIAYLKAAAKQSAIDARNNEFAAWGIGAGAIAVGTVVIGALIGSTAASSAAGGVASALRGLKTAADAAKAAASRSAGSMGQNSRGTGMGDRWSPNQFNSYQPQGQVISEKKMKSFNQFKKELYPGQPSSNGFPDQDPPKQLPNGFHQDYGQKDNMYNTLDKTSAMSMPPTGNPEIDKKVEKAKKQPK